MSESDCESEKDNVSLSSEPLSMSQGTDQNHAGEESTGSLTIAKAETRAVNRSKVMVLLVIAIAAAACGTATYFFTSAEEKDNFHRQVRKD
jgi:hypothetical protein